MQVQCKTCNIKFDKVDSEIRKGPNHFCSRSCAAKTNNVLYGKGKKLAALNKPQGKCKSCECLINKRRTYCKDCFLKTKFSDKPYSKKGKLHTHIKRKERIRKPKERCPDCNVEVSWGAYKCKKCMHHFVMQRGDTLTLREMINDSGYKGNTYNSIRGRARTKAKNLGWKSCSNCGYDKHIEICHKKEISSFSLDATVGEINDESNLIPLCPNCHWELDHLILV